MVKEEDYVLFSKKNRQFIESLNKAASPVLSSEEPEEIGKLRTIFADISQTDENKDVFGVISLLADAELEDGGPEELELCLFQLKKLELKNELGRLSGVIKNDPSQQLEEHLKEFDQKAREFHFKS